MLHHLREHELAQVHPYLPRAVRPQDGPVPRRRRGSNRQLDEGSLSKRFSTTYHDRSAQRWDTTGSKCFGISPGPKEFMPKKSEKWRATWTWWRMRSAWDVGKRAAAPRKLTSARRTI